jgi:hypothetical protein
MVKLIFKIAMCKSKVYLCRKYSKEWYSNFYTSSLKKLQLMLPKIPNIGNSIFSFNYKFAPVYIAWYKTFVEMNVSDDEITKNIWVMNENMTRIIPKPFMHLVGKIYFGSFRKKASKHIKKQNTIGIHPYDWRIEYQNIDRNCFEIDIKACGIKKMVEDYDAQGLLPGICRMDYLFANLMNNGFERTKTLGDGDDCCNCKYSIVGSCEWAPEKGFIDRK